MKDFDSIMKQIVSVKKTDVEAKIKAVKESKSHISRLLHISEEE